jgi:beta-N-acetylhexosaminidase
MSIAASELFIFGFDKLSIDSYLKNYLAKNPVGGLILFKRNIESLEQLIALNSDIINASTHVPLISVDQEGGRVARLRGIVSDIEPLRSLAPSLLKDPHRAYRLGALIGRELVALGFHLNFAPVCDVAVEQKNEDIIGDRAFSHDAQEVALLASRFIEGMQGSGLAACAKHFPGHGATTIDSHFLLPAVHTSHELLEERELLPFKAAIKANVATIMTAHLVATSYDNKNPATLSEHIINNILRSELDYKNIIISDDLDMKAIADNYDLEEILEKALIASVDMFIIGNNLDKTFEAINLLQKLIDKSPALAQKAYAARMRIDKLRTRFIGKAAPPDIKLARLIVKSAPHLELLNSYR